MRSCCALVALALVACSSKGGGGKKVRIAAASNLQKAFTELAKAFDSKQLLDILTTIGGYRMVSMALNTFGVQLEEKAERFPPSLR